MNKTLYPKSRFFQEHSKFHENINHHNEKIENYLVKHDCKLSSDAGFTPHVKYELQDIITLRSFLLL